MRLADAKTGPSALSLAPPAYPMDAVRLGIEATVTVTVEVNADGSPVIVETTYEISDKSRSARYGKVFLDAATEAVKRWKVRPGMVAGHGEIGRAHDRTPVSNAEYRMTSSACKKKN